MARYAEGTSVSSEKSRMEMESILRRYGADAFMYGWEGEHARISFRAAGRYVRFDLPLPDRNDREFTHHSRGRRTPDAYEAAYEQSVRQRWRALALVIKAKLEAVAAGISVFEDEFLAHTLLPNGQTVGEWTRPQIAIAYEQGTMPPLLGGPEVNR